MRGSQVRVLQAAPLADRHFLALRLSSLQPVCIGQGYGALLHMVSWEKLKTLTGSNIARYVIFVPIVGWLLIYQNEFVKLFSSIFELDSVDYLGWEVLVFYLGLIFIGISASLFHFFGPPTILNHGGIQGFIEDMESVLTRREFHIFCEDNNYPIPDEITVQTAGTGQIGGSTRDQWLRLNSGQIRDVLSDHYRNKDSERPKIRLFISSIFLFGVLLTFTPTAVTVFWVIQQLLHSIR